MGLIGFDYGTDSRYPPLQLDRLAKQSTNPSDDNNIVEAAMTDIDAEYEALCADALCGV